MTPVCLINTLSVRRDRKFTKSKTEVVHWGSKLQTRSSFCIDGNFGYEFYKYITPDQEQLREMQV